jgi:hypothetical protein
MPNKRTLHVIVLYCIVLYCIVLYCIVFETLQNMTKLASKHHRTIYCDLKSDVVLPVHFPHLLRIKIDIMVE